jgi:competence protein ComFB
MELLNAMEAMVFAYLDKLIETSSLCKCEQCRLDIAAIALNNLPTQYVVTAKGQLFAKIAHMGQQHQTDVTTKILEAIDVVSQKPRHPVQ